MSEEQDTSAFPLHLHGDYGKGMTLRDYFAAAALPSILSYSNEIRAKADAEWAEREGIAKPCDLNDDSADSETLSYRSSSCAIAAYIIADAMLAARKEGA
jgi:hypothetical protein